MGSQQAADSPGQAEHYRQHAEGEERGQEAQPDRQGQGDSGAFGAFFGLDAQSVADAMGQVVRGRGEGRPGPRGSGGCDC